VSRCGFIFFVSALPCHACDTSIVVSQSDQSQVLPTDHWKERKECFSGVVLDHPERGINGYDGAGSWSLGRDGRTLGCDVSPRTVVGTAKKDTEKESKKEKSLVSPCRFVVVSPVHSKLYE
jgi:hypothetical protein